MTLGHGPVVGVFFPFEISHSAFRGGVLLCGLDEAVMCVFPVVGPGAWSPNGWLMAGWRLKELCLFFSLPAWLRHDCGANGKR